MHTDARGIELKLGSLVVAAPGSGWHSPVAGTVERFTPTGRVTVRYAGRTGPMFTRTVFPGRLIVVVGWPQ